MSLASRAAFSLACLSVLAMVFVELATAAPKTVTTSRIFKSGDVRKGGMRFLAPYGEHSRYDFYETPNVARYLATCRKLPWKVGIMSTSFFLSRRLLKIAANTAMPRWQDRLYILLTATSARAVEFFHIPTDRSVELGTQISI